MCNWISCRPPVTEQNNKLIECRLPVPQRPGPLLRHPVQTQVQQFEYRFVIGKGPAILQHLAHRVIQRLDSIGRIQHPAYFRGKIKEHRQALPVGPPGPADGWIFLVPACGEVLQGLFGLTQGRRPVDGQKVRRNGLALSERVNLVSIAGFYLTI